MQLMEWSEFLDNGLDFKTSMTVGIFDGVHRGHQALIERVVSHNADYVPVVVTFRENHKTETDIITFEEKTKLLEKLGVEILIVIDFTEPFKRIGGLEFLEILWDCAEIGFFAVGGNFRCGYKLDTGSKEINDFFVSHDTPVEIIPEVMEGGLPVSSSRIRSCLASGDTELARKMLGSR
jgi:riboflavin kinase/FMN adenylyltransferase